MAVIMAQGKRILAMHVLRHLCAYPFQPLPSLKQQVSYLQGMWP